MAFLIAGLESTHDSTSVRLMWRALCPPFRPMRRIVAEASPAGRGSLTAE